MNEQKQVDEQTKTTCGSYRSKNHRLAELYFHFFSVHIPEVPQPHLAHALPSSVLWPCVYFPVGLLASPSCIICGKIVHVCLGQRWATTLENIRRTQELFYFQHTLKIQWALSHMCTSILADGKNKNLNLILNCN